MRPMEPALERQRALSRALSPLWLPLAAAAMRFGFGWRVAERARLRAAYRKLRRESDAPLLICPNHLTMLDSFVIGWALGSPLDHLRDFGGVPWNTPDRVRFASRGWQRVLLQLVKCIPLPRGGDRHEVAAVLDRVVQVLRRGDAALVFPEGGRSRSGRVEVENAAYGIGRIVRAVPGCRVLCVYLRGEGQQGFGDRPRRGERFHVRTAWIEPKSDHAGLRGSLDVARQIVEQLARLEAEYFAARAGAEPSWTGSDGS